MYHYIQAVCLGKTDAENSNSYPRMQTNSGRFAFVFVVNEAGIRRATYPCLDSTKNMDKDWDISVSFIIQVNFDHVWAEHYIP